MVRIATIRNVIKVVSAVVGWSELEYAFIVFTLVNHRLRVPAWPFNTSLAGHEIVNLSMFSLFLYR